MRTLSLVCQIQNVRPEACDDKQHRKCEKIKNGETKREQYMSKVKMKKFFFLLCERKSGWAGHGAQCCVDRVGATYEMIELYLFIFMYLFVTTKWKQSAFHRISRRARTAGSCRSPGLLPLSPSHRKNGIHFVNLAVPLAHTALSLSLSLCVCWVYVWILFILFVSKN